MCVLDTDSQMFAEPAKNCWQQLKVVDNSTVEKSKLWQEKGAVSR